MPPVRLHLTPGMCQSCPLLFPPPLTHVTGPPTTRAIAFDVRSVSQRVFLFALSSACSTLPTPFRTLPSTCFATPFACCVLLPVSSPTLRWTLPATSLAVPLLDRGSWCAPKMRFVLKLAEHESEKL